MAITLESAPLQVSTSKNPIIFRFDSADISQPNHRFTLALNLELGSKTAVVDLMDFALSGQLVKFEVSELLDAWLQEAEYETPLSSETSAAWNNISDFVLAAFTATVNEAYGFPLTEGSSIGYPSEFTKYYVLRGGFSYPNWPEEKYLYDWFRQSDGNCPFLTWKPKSCMVSVNQPEYLAFLDVTDTAGASRSFVIESKVYYTDGTNATATSTPFSGVTFRAYRFPVGPTQLGLPSLNPSKTIQYYEVRIKNGSSYLSEKRTYYVDFQRHQAERYIMFMNSLGGMDTVRFIGTGEFQPEYTRSGAEIYNGQYTNTHGTRRLFKVEEKAGKKINTGFITRGEVQWLRDLFLTTYAFEYTNGRYIPIEIVSKKFASAEESALNALTLEYDHNFKNEVFTPGYQTVNYIP